MLSIEETCLLRGDSWHLLNEVWPKPHNFGDRFHEVKHFLKSMLQCRTQSEWDAAYQGARLLLANSPMRVDKLDLIHSNPKYYAGYYLTSIAEGSLGKQGDTPAEQNHSSVVAHIGKGGTFQIVEQCKSLLERQQTRTRLKLSRENDLSMDIHRYKSKLSGPEGHADNEACKHLSRFAHRKFLDLLKRAATLQHSVDDMGNHNVWPASILRFEDARGDRRQQIPANERCQCYSRRALLFQCEHEFAIDRKFHWEKFSARWLNHKTYNTKVKRLPSYRMLAQPILEIDCPANDPSTSFQHSYCQQTQDDFSCAETVDLQSFNEPIPTPHPNVTYQRVIHLLTNLAKSHQSSQQELSKLETLALDAIEGVKAGQRMTYQIMYEPPAGVIEQEMSILAMAPNGAAVNQKRSRHEHYNSRKPKKDCVRSQLSSTQGDDDHVLEPKRVRTCACRLCRGPHGVSHCDKICVDGNRPLQDGDMQARVNLSMQIASSNVYHTLDLPNGALTSTSLPQKTKAIVMRQRYNNGAPGDEDTNIYVKADFYTTGGELMVEHSNTYFQAIEVGTWMVQGKTRLVVDAMPRAIGNKVSDKVTFCIGCKPTPC